MTYAFHYLPVRAATCRGINCISRYVLLLLLPLLHSPPPRLRAPLRRFRDNFTSMLRVVVNISCLLQYMYMFIQFAHA